jgi:pyruvate kinase
MTGKAKIIGTIGPASSSEETLMQLVDAGLNVARLNFSHGAHEDHLETIKNIRKIRKKTGKNIGILQDLSGPKIRVGVLPDHGIALEDGDELLFKPGTEFSEKLQPLTIPIDYPNLLKDIQERARILLDDGLLEMEVVRRTSSSLECRVVNGGVLFSHKGVNFPGCVISQRAPTKKDMEDLVFGLEHGVDYVALSFVQTEDDIKVLRREIERRNGHVSVIAKLETRTALERLDAILPECDGVMVARGDLGIETELTMLPVYQKRIISMANQLGITSIVATQMLDSMIRNPIPTRAEVTDVANAIEDGADAVMLSGETAVGKYPVDAVRTMRQIAENIELNIGGRLTNDRRRSTYETGEMAVASSVCTSAQKLEAELIVAHTLSGQTARLISRFRPKTAIVAVTPNEATLYQLSMNWGVESVLVPGFEEDFLETIYKSDKVLVDSGYAKRGDTVIVSGGIPAKIAGGTNVMKIHKVGDD